MHRPTPGQTPGSPATACATNPDANEITWADRAQQPGLHEVRKSAKRARYAVEPAVPVSGKPATRLAIRMKALPNVLGEHQDSVAAQSPLLELAIAALEPGKNGFPFGLLYAQERTRANDVHRAHQPALRQASTTRARRWTR
jgi:CHAD domain-containing protein